MFFFVFFPRIFNSQVLPEEGTVMSKVMKALEYTFAGIFTVELVINLFRFTKP